MDLPSLGKATITPAARLLERCLTAVPAAQRAATAQLIVKGLYTVAALAIVAWLLATATGTHVTGASCGVTAGRDATGNSPNCAK